MTALADQPDWTGQRRAMVERQLRPRGIKDEGVLAAMGRVPREVFLPPDLAREAYSDCALPIDCEQTISQPVIVAMMTQALHLGSGVREHPAGAEPPYGKATYREAYASRSPGLRVLEIGTGSGYQAAILAELAAEVFSIERHAELSRQAGQRLADLGYENIHLRIGDGSRGWPEAAPFDRVIITAAAEEPPPAVWEQLAEGGVLVGPFGPPAEQLLYEMHKIGGRPKSQILTGCRFVPLIHDSAS